MAQHDGGGSVKAIVKAEPVGGLSSLLLDEAMEGIEDAAARRVSPVG